MRTPRQVSWDGGIRRGAAWVGALLAAALALAAPARGDDAAWRLARRGRELFLRDWRPDDPRCHGGDGLGPLYNATSCVACHGQGGPGGAGPLSTNVNLLNLAKFDNLSLISQGEPQAQGRRNGRAKPPVVLARAVVIERLHPGLRDSPSLVLHHFATDPNYAARRAMLLDLELPTSQPQARSEGRADPGPSDGRPESTDAELIRQLRESRRATVTQRSPTPLFGIGLIDAIPGQVIAAGEVPGSSRQVSGRVHRLKGGRVGKFGWKAQIDSLQEFVLTACGNELGLENPGHRQPASPLDADAVARKPDLTGAECDALVAFVRDLPPPAVLDLGAEASAAVDEGRRVFASTGCADCHRPSLGGVDGLYSDLLLHDMGPGLSDSGQYYGSDDSGSPGSPGSSEWRTPPLWGLRESAPYLHDGRAATLAGAIADHGGEASESLSRYRALSIEERFRLESFLRTLTAPGSPGALERRSESARDAWRLDRAAAAAEARERDRRRAEEEALARAKAEKARIAKEARRVDGRLQIARMTEFNGHASAALNLYRELIRSHPNSPAAREARERVGALAGDR